MAPKRPGVARACQSWHELAQAFQQRELVVAAAYNSASPIRRDKGVRTRSKLLDAVVHTANEQDYKNGVRKQLSFEFCRGLQLRKPSTRAQNRACQSRTPILSKPA